MRTLGVLSTRGGDRYARGDEVIVRSNRGLETGSVLCEATDAAVAELKDPVKDKLKRFGLHAEMGEGAFFPTVGAAVSRYLKTHDVEWVDWEDRLSGRRRGDPQ